MFEGLKLKRVLLRILSWFSCHFAGFHVANRVITLLLRKSRCVKSFSAFFVANIVMHAHRQRVYRSFHDATIGRSHVRAQQWLLQRLLGLFVERSALMRNSV